MTVARERILTQERDEAEAQVEELKTEVDRLRGVLAVIRAAPDHAYQYADAALRVQQCRHRRILDQGAAGRFCAECGNRIDVAACGAVHRLALAVCTLPIGHTGDHANEQGYWMPRSDEKP